MFDFLSQTTAAGRMAELARFIEHWYGPRRPEYGEADGDLYSLPDPLKRFLAFAGRWPAPHAAFPGRCIADGDGHHLRPLDAHVVRKDGRLVFFHEYQGEWDGLTLTSGEDPPVWIAGYFDGDYDRRRVRKVSDSLSAFLVTHLLFTTAYDRENSLFQSDGRVAFLGGTRIWSAEDGRCPNYDGEFYWHDGVLFHTTAGSSQCAANHPDAVEWLRDVIGG
jgi:hypothetical protein